MDNRQQRINQIKLQIARSVTQSRWFRPKTSTYAAPTRAIPARIKKLLKELDHLEVQGDCTTKTQDIPDNVVGYAEP